MSRSPNGKWKRWLTTGFDFKSQPLNNVPPLPVRGVEHDAEISLVVTIQQVTMYVLTMVCILEERRSSSESESLSESKISSTSPGENIT